MTVLAPPVWVWLFGIPALVSAVLAVTVRNLVHAVLWLGVMLAATAGLFACLGASFLAAIQVLLYIGGVVTLLVFGVMLTGRIGGGPVLRETMGHGRAALVAIGLFAVLALSILRTPGLDRSLTLTGASPGDLASTLLGKDLLAFEVLSLLLLAVMVGAIVVARPRDPGPAGEAAP